MAPAAVYQGAPGAFSEDAARELLGDGFELRPERRFEDVLDALARGAASFGVLPIENTLAGSVDACVDLIATRDVTIVGETILRISHALVAAPGVMLAQVRRVLSHPVALAQCEEFFRRHHHLEPVPVYDTAGAVMRVVGDRLPEAAAIAGRRAAAVHGGVVLAEALEDHPENYTRFVLVAPTTAPTARTVPLSPNRGRGEQREGLRLKTSLVFRIASRPGALCACLRAFAERGIDLTRIESRPVKGAPFEYSFYLDLIPPPENPAAVHEAAAELAPRTTFLKHLGTYVSARPASNR